MNPPATPEFPEELKHKRAGMLISNESPYTVDGDTTTVQGIYGGDKEVCLYPIDIEVEMVGYWLRTADGIAREDHVRFEPGFDSHSDRIQIAFSKRSFFGPVRRSGMRLLPSLMRKG